MGAIKPAINGDWLNIDSAANAGSGTVAQVNPGSNIPNPAVPTAGHAIAPDQPDFAPVSDSYLWENSHWSGAWPSFTQDGWKQGPVATPQGDIHGEPDPYANNLARKTGTVRVDRNTYEGYDAHSQTTDTAGWRINTPSGRTSARVLIGADGVGYEAQWFESAARPIPKRMARTAAPNTSPNGTPGVLNGAQLPAYADTSVGGPGNIAYATPAPPQTAQAPAAQAGASSWQWGF